MNQPDQYKPSIAWRFGLSVTPNRDPVEMDVRDGRAEYLLSGPYKLAEGCKIEVIDGQVLWSSGKSRP